jgi:hypothetical protein
MKMKNKQAEQNAAKLRHKEKLKANRRSQPDLERKEAFLNIKPTILIVCEGKNTEPSYFNHFRLTSAKVVPVGLGFNTISLVNRAIELSQHLNMNKSGVCLTKMILLRTILTIQFKGL